jgi:hypothetical protein
VTHESRMRRAVCVRLIDSLWHVCVRAWDFSKDMEAEVTYRGRVEGGQIVTDASDLLPEGANVLIEVLEPAGTVEAGSQPLAGTRFDSTGAGGLIGTSVSNEAVVFCREKGLLNELSRAIDLAKKCFSIIGSPTVDLVHDRETDDLAYLSVEIHVRGAVMDNVMADRKFAEEAARLLGAKRELITLHYDII